MVDPDDLYILLETIHFAGMIEGRKRFQKTICVLKHRNHISLGFHFMPYYYGPYSEDLADSIQSLIGAGFVNEEANEIADGIYQYRYSLTEFGRNAIINILENNLQIRNTTPNQLRELVIGINTMELNELVRLSKTLDLEDIEENAVENNEIVV